MVKWFCPRCNDDHEKYEQCPRYAGAEPPEKLRKAKYDCDNCGKKHAINEACPLQRKPPMGYERPEYHKLYNRRWWRKIRLVLLNENPFCKLCDEPATDVDHIEPHRGDTEKFYDENNLQTLCKSCHSLKTVQDRANV